MGVIVNLSFLRSRLTSRDWTTQEIAEFYRVESALVQAGLSIATDRGLSDEGDPWFVFCRQDTQEVIAHFARINNQYVIVSSAFSGIARGTDFRALVNELLDSNPLVLPVKRQPGQKILLHPASLLVALVAAAYVMAGDKASAALESGSDGGEKPSWISSLLRQELAFLSVVTIAVSWLENQADGTIVDFIKNALGPQHDETLGGHAGTSPVGQDGTSIEQIAGIMLDSGSATHNSTDKQPIAIPVDGEDVAVPPVQSSIIASANLGVRPSTADHDQSGSNDQSGHSDFALSLGLDGPAHLGRTGVDGLANLPEWPVSEPDTAPVPATNVAPQPATTNSIAATDAFHLVASQLPLSQLIVLSTDPSTLDSAIHQAISQVGITDTQLHSSDEVAISSDAAATTHSSSTADTNVVVSQSVTSPSPTQQNAPSTVSSSPVVTETAAVQYIENFLQHTPNYEVIEVGKVLVFMDTNLADTKSPDFGVLSLEMSDGSTVSIVGIITHPQTVAA